MKNYCATTGALRAMFIGLFSAALSAPAESEVVDHGAPRGTLIAIGGGSERGAGILERFINRAGGPDANFVIVPTGNGNRSADGQPKAYREEDVLAIWRTRGLKHVRMLHTTDPAVANTDAFVQPLREASAIWFEGDHQQDLLASYANTLAAREFAQVLRRGGVIAGNAAGATTLGAHLLRSDLSALGRASASELGPPGFGFLPQVVFDLQVNTRQRWDDLSPLVRSNPEILGIGLSETTAIMVTGDRFEVVGKWAVTVHDSTLVHRPHEKAMRLLFPGTFST